MEKENASFKALFEKELTHLRQDMPENILDLPEKEQLSEFFFTLKRLRPNDYKTCWGINLGALEELKNIVIGLSKMDEKAL